MFSTLILRVSPTDSQWVYAYPSRLPFRKQALIKGIPLMSGIITSSTHPSLIYSSRTQREGERPAQPSERRSTYPYAPFPNTASTPTNSGAFYPILDPLGSRANTLHRRSERIGLRRECSWEGGIDREFIGKVILALAIKQWPGYLSWCLDLGRALLRHRSSCICTLSF